MRRTEIVTEVAGKVWKIEARPGSRLAAGNTILILESMKMEIPVAAFCAGKLAELRVKEGEMLQEGDIVAVVE